MKFALIIAAQIVGVLAVTLYLLSYQLKRRCQIVWVTCISNVLYVLQYIMLGAFTGALMDALSTVSSFFAARKNNPKLKRYLKLIIWVSMLVIASAGLALAIIQKDPIELLPIAGALFQTGGLWFENEQTIRKFGLCSVPFWLVYNFISKAYGATLGSVLALVSVITALIRYRKMNNKID